MITPPPHWNPCTNCGVVIASAALHTCGADSDLTILTRIEAKLDALIARLEARGAL